MSNVQKSQQQSPSELTSEKKYKKYSRIFPETEGDDVVISGIAGKFPNCHNVEEYEHNLFNKIDMVDDDERRWRHFNPEIPRRSGKIYDLEKFDATFFGVHFKQAHTLDPQTRVLMETAYEAVVDAGINPKSLRGTKTGVYVGSCISESEKTWFYEKVSSGGFGITGCSRAMLPNRISYALGLQGPSFLVDTACSSSMYALDNAFTALRNGEIDAAIVGGTNLSLHPFVTLQFARLGVLAADGVCRPFDKDASGYTRSEAINCIFLQRKRDAKRIYATVMYSKTNCDGFKSEGITYPSGKMQEQLLKEFYQEVDVSLNDLGYLEAHSTGTVVGDPEECRAIDNVICTQRISPLLVGSVKSNVGHSEAASGINSLIKACLAFKNGKIPPNINFSEVKPEIAALAEGRLVVVKDVTDLKKPYIGVNSFGFGGANAHALLKGFDKFKVNHGVPDDDIPRLVTWAGRNEESVNTILDAIEKRPLDVEFLALLYNIQNVEESGMVFRGFGICRKNDMQPATVLTRNIQHYTGIKRPVVWVFSGMGSQWSEMGTSLMIIPKFRQSIERCHKALVPKGLDLIHILTSADPKVFDNILHSFVGIAAIQIGLVDVLKSLNLEPDYIIGHSVGELGCGYADGGFTPEQMILASYYRGKVSLEIDKIKGSMAAIGIGFKQIVNLLPDSIEVACHNGADSCTISGPTNDVAKFVEELKSKNIFAKEVPCSNIAYHSRYIAHMGPHLLKYLQQTIPKPKPRSSKWLSSSVPKNEWEQPGRNLCSAEYHTNNLLSSVLFEETFALLPNNALTIEIAPHGLLQAILKRSMPGGIHIPLTQRGNKNNGLFFLEALGKLFINGINFPVQNLYPKVEFPVSLDTPGISSLVRWEHKEDWFVTKYENMKTKSSGERVFTVNLGGDNEEYLAGHVIDGKILVPATCYLGYVWETFSLMYHGPSYMDVPVQFEDVRFLRATNISAKTSVDLTVMIHYGTGNFEITESGVLVSTGRIFEIENPTIPKVHNFKEKCDIPMMSKKDFYKELKLRGYHYNGCFQAVQQARSDGLYGRVEWKYNWVTFMDAMLQIYIVGTDARNLHLPTKIRKLRINGAHHMSAVTAMDPDNRAFDVYIDRGMEKIVAGGIEVIGLYASQVQRRKPPAVPVLEKYNFLPHFPSPVVSAADAARICIQLGYENNPVLKIKIVEIDTDGRTPILPNFLDAVEDLPVITGDYIFLSNQALTNAPAAIHVENTKVSKQSNCHFIVVGGLGNAISGENIASYSKALVDGGYLVVRESTSSNINDLMIPHDFKILVVMPLDNNEEVILLLQKVKKNFDLEPLVIEVSEADHEFEWLAKVQQAIANKTSVVVYAFNEKLNGLIGLVNCLRKEPDGQLVTGFFVDDLNAPPFCLDGPFYGNQFELNLAINVYKNGKWGSYRHLQLKVDKTPIARADHVYGNVIQYGDLSSLRWFKGPFVSQDCEIRIVYSSVNFRDVMLATGRLAFDLCGSSRQDNSCVLGFEYSGIEIKTGRRVMSMTAKSGIASYADKPSRLIWEVPKTWSLRDAATMPVVYITVYYAFFLCADIRKGKSILIHAGTGGVGLAAIRIALAYNLEVFTTCSTPQKKKYLLETFPQLKESHIGNSRDTSFELMVHRETNGNGVDFVLNSLAEDKLLASVRCLAVSGHFLEIGKFDMANDSKLGMSCFLKNIAFHAVLADTLVTAPDELIDQLFHHINFDLERGVIKPLPTTVFPAPQIEQAFRYLIGGKHIGKVLIQVREDPESSYTIPINALNQMYFNPKLCYVIPGGLGGFGLEFADWLVLRGARNILLSSSRGITKDYQTYRISLWKSYGCSVKVSTSDITTFEGCDKLLEEAAEMAPVGGIFNLAVVLRDDFFTNLTKDKFLKSFAPKAIATKYLDTLSRKNCPKLEHFVVFSSVSCGRGNIGQTNYGMANSIMERVVEDRVANGYPGKAIQWGAVGEVGLVADMAEDKIDMVIGGTLQQRISSCLQELDNLLSVPDAIVSSMVVAEKRAGRAGAENIVETVMNIMGIRDLKSVSLGTALSEMGMDSLMAVEIKQALERDFELVLTPQDLRSLTFQKLQEISDARLDREDTNKVKIMFVSDSKDQDMNMLLRNLGDEANCKKILVQLNTRADTSRNSMPPTIIIPGLEGTAGQAWNKIGSNLINRAMVLQLYNFSEMTTVKDIAEVSYEHVKSVLNVAEPFYIIGYSFGSYVSLQLVALLEKAGYRGHLLLIDGAPHFLTKLTRLQLSADFVDNDLYDLLLSIITNLIFQKDTNEPIGLVFRKIPTIEGKMKKYIEYVSKQDLYSAEYAITLLNAMFRRVKMAANYDLESIEELKTPITLIRPSEVALQDIEEDYCLSRYTSGKVILKIIEGNHTTMLDNPKLSQLINEFDPTAKDDKNFEEYIRDGTPIKFL